MPITDEWTLDIVALELRAGVRQEPPTSVGVFDTRSRFRRRDLGTLFVVVELQGDGLERAQVVRTLVQLVRDTYLAREGSVTRRLQTALQAAHRHLQEVNAEVRGAQWEAGITAAALVGDELFLAQAGPTLAYLSQPGVQHWFPEGAPWLREAAPEATGAGLWAPLGTPGEIVVHFGYRQVVPGYTLLLASPRLLRWLPPEELAPRLDQAPEGIAKDLAAIASGQDFSALIVAFTEEPEVEAPATTEAPLPAEPARPGVLAQTVVALWRGLMTVGGTMALIAERVGEILRELLPKRRELGVRESMERRRRWFLGLALLIPILLAVLTGFMYWSAHQDRETAFQRLLQRASERRAVATATSDPTQVRQLLIAAMADVERALTLRPEDPAARQLRRVLQADLDRLQGIVRLLSLRSIASLPGAAADPRRLIVMQGQAYVLDRAASVLYRVDLNTGGITQMLQAGETRNGRVVGPLVDMAWVSAGGPRLTDNIVVLDITEQLWQVGADGSVTPLAVSAGDWQQPRLAGGYEGNFYVLDAGYGQILKYLPTAEGYTDPPSSWLEPDADVRLDDVVDMAIDGAVYLLRADGRVEKLTMGRPRPFDQPDEFDLTAPVTLFALPPPDRVYLADTRRVLQLTTEGAFQRQLLPPEGTFQHLSALWIDEGGRRLYVVDNGTLAVGDMP